MKWLWALLLLSVCAWAQEAPRYLNPVAIAPDLPRERAYVALNGSSALAVVDLRGKRLNFTWPLSPAPSGVALSPDGRVLAATLGETDGEIVLLDPLSGAERHRFAAGFSPVAPVWVQGGKRLAVCNRFHNTVSLFDPDTRRRPAVVQVTREPIAAVASADGNRLFVGGAMPTQAATSNLIACAVDVVDVRQAKVLRSILLPNGSTGLQALALTPDGRQVLVTHIVGHYQVPTNQLERGWMNANALSVIDVAKGVLLGTVLLDDTTLGAANPWGVGVTSDGQYLAVAHAGTDQVSRIPWPALLASLGKEPTLSYEGEEGLSRDLTLMSKLGRERIPTAEGPRALAMFGSRALVAEYFRGSLASFDLAQPKVQALAPTRIELGQEPQADEVRQGEMRFSDARLCFQHWQSCLSCHPSTRADGLNWDLLNDGLGNPKQTKSMLFAHETPPSMALGIRGNAEVAVRAGIRFIQFAPVDEKQARHIDAYLRALRPLPSPALVKGELSPLAVRGREIYNRIGCGECHPAPYYTDLKQYKVKHAEDLDAERTYDTPTLREVWRTAPYLYDGRATTLEEALRHKDNGVDKLSSEEFKALVEYVRSL